MKHRMRFVGIWLACGLALAPLVAAAQEDVGAAAGPGVEFTPGKFFDLAVCVVSIAAVEPGVGATMAVLSCSRAAVAWWSE